MGTVLRVQILGCRGTDPGIIRVQIYNVFLSEKRNTVGET